MLQLQTQVATQKFHLSILMEQVHLQMKIQFIYLLLQVEKMEQYLATIINLIQELQMQILELEN